MQASYILEWTTAAAGHLKNGKNDNAAEILEALKAEAAAEIRREEAKKSGKADRQKAAERVIKNAKKSRYPERLGGAWITPDGMQNICDSFQAYRLRDPLPLEELPKDVDKVNIDRIVVTNCGDAVPLPELPELRAYIKEEKARLKAQKDKSAPLWDFGDGLPALNAEFLLTALEILPGCTATAAKAYAETRAVYFKSDAGEGVILPVKKA
jgi:hypothetical protein